MDPREQIWANAFNAALALGEADGDPDVDVAYAARMADVALEAHEERWPTDRNVLSMNDVDKRVAAECCRAVEKIMTWAVASATTSGLAESGRRDAHEVLDSFVCRLRDWLAYDSTIVTKELPRWEAPAQRSAATGLDSTLMANVIGQLEAGKRYDALLVISSLFEAVKAAQQRGEVLTAWNPPSRGT